MTKKLRIAVLFGGRSAEHEVSLMSARNVVAALDRSRYEIVPIGIARDGRWLLLELEGGELPSELEFVDSIDTTKPPRKPPVLVLSDEQRRALGLSTGAMPRGRFPRAPRWPERGLH